MTQKTSIDYKIALQSSKLDNCSPIEIGDEMFWIPTPHLEYLLNEQMRGKVLKDEQGEPYKVRTRSKVLKAEACLALGYPVPKSFKQVKPKFFGQQFDIYGQKANNLQIWNEPIHPTRRYGVVDISDEDVIIGVKVVYGQDLLLLDKTGKITKKYQARFDVRTESSELFSRTDTDQLQHIVKSSSNLNLSKIPTSDPDPQSLLSIEKVYELLSELVGSKFKDPGADQERNRGAALHSLVCKALGYSSYGDNGKFPDIRHQLLEVKLQTSPTIDLGMILPDSEENLVIPPVGKYQPRHCDTRYAVFYANTDGKNVTLTHLVVATGKDFFRRFTRFGGRESNGKIQIPLPRDFFISQPENSPY